MKAFSVDINPKILAWARQEAGYGLPEIAEYLKADEDILEQWETDGLQVKYTDLTKLAKRYKRQIPVFFLENTPAKTKKPKDYRNLSLTSKGLHHETMLAIRRTSRYLRIYREMSNSERVNEQYGWLDKVRNTTVPHAVYIREVLDVPIAEQKKSKNQTFNFWRKRFEDKLGIFVFQFPIPNGEFDGFSYIDEGRPYAITINNRIMEKRKIFTLFHELGHIIEGHAGLCLTIDANHTAHNIEAKCNTFAAQFLMPQTEMAHPITFDELGKLAGGLGVSREAYLIRCKSLNLVTEQEFNQYITILHQINANLKKDKKSTPMAIPRDVISRSQRGDKFFDFVVSAYDSNQISPAAVRDLLDMKVVGLGRPPK